MVNDSQNTACVKEDWAKQKGKSSAYLLKTPQKTVKSPKQDFNKS